MMMQTLKLLFSKITDDDPVYEKKDVVENIFVFRMLLVWQLLYTFVFILNCLDIFIVDKHIFATGYILSCVLLLVFIALLVIVGPDHACAKYLCISDAGFIVLITSSSLTYHMVIVAMLPIVIAGVYSSKHLSRFAFVWTLFNIALSTYVGYYFGVCDANMALLTTTSLKHLQKDGIFLLNEVNKNPKFTLFMYYVFPRALIATGFYSVSDGVNKMIRRTMEKAHRIKHEAAMDDMTGFYNKNKLLNDLEKLNEPDRNVAVIYWDVNQLKFVNDTYGHERGDRLIARIAGTIRLVSANDNDNDNARTYRYGGDEFIMIIPDGTEEVAISFIDRWNKLMEPLQKDSKIPISASVGYACGRYADINEIISEADERMYENKRVRRE
mgnify:FL=1